jgi:hypothetical protein
MSHPIHPAKPNAATPATRPGEQPLAGMREGDACLGNAATPASGTPHSPQRDGDNSGGESTASQQRSADKGHQRAPRPGIEDHQGGH